jgi:hypothetical protein
MDEAETVQRHADGARQVGRGCRPPGRELDSHAARLGKQRGLLGESPHARPIEPTEPIGLRRHPFAVGQHRGLVVTVAALQGVDEG